MFCTECGAEIDNKAVICPKCGVPVVSKSTAVPNHLVAAVLTTLFCCLPCGIVAIVYATQVNSRLAMGDIAGAKEASSKANGWMVAGVIIGLITAGAWTLLGAF